MKASVAVSKEADAKKGVSPTKSSDSSIQRLRNEPERQLGSLRDVIGNTRRDGSTPSVDSIATELSSMHTAQRAPVLLALQRTHGNRYVQRVVTGIQAKLVVGQPGDMYEQEADRVADAVMRMPEPEVQRQAEEEEKEEEEIIRTKPLAEQITPLIQRQSEEEEEKILQTKEVSWQSSELTSDFESRIQTLMGGGQPLPEYARDFFEPRFGYDFSGVRIHNDVHVAESAKTMNAQAFTFKTDIGFALGQYKPETSSGKRLLAHELVHIVQQGEAVSNIIQRVQRKEETLSTGKQASPRRLIDIPGIRPIMAEMWRRSVLDLRSLREYSIVVIINTQTQQLRVLSAEGPPERLGQPHRVPMRCPHTLRPHESVLGTVHTHPDSSTMGVQEPSQEDRANVAGNPACGTEHYVIAHRHIYRFTRSGHTIVGPRQTILNP